MRNILLISFMFASGIAAAGPIQDHTCQGGHNCNTNGHGTITGGDSSAVSSSSSAATAVSSSSSSASADSSNVNLNVAEGGNAYATGGEGGNAYAAGGEGGVGYASQGQSQLSDNSNSSNNSASQNINIEGDENVGRHENNWGNNVSAYAPAIYSSSACTAGGLSGGVSGLGFGVALGGAKQDPQCQVRENARVLASLDANLALLYMCANPLIDVGSVLGVACKPAPTPEPVPLPEPTPDPIPVPHIDDKVKG